MAKTLVLTGGGTAGHVTPNLALIPLFQKEGWDVHYIGSYDGMERDLISRAEGVTYHAIDSGKLRRYRDLKNLSDPFHVIHGAFQAARIIAKLRPRVLFAKGGFVSVPAVFGAWIHRVPVVTHESDLTPGLANRLTLPMATTACATFPAAAEGFGKKGVWTGSPIRESLFSGSRQKGLQLCGFSDTGKPVLLIMGGSLGARAINEAVDESLPELLKSFRILHIRGAGGLNPDLSHTEGYAQFTYLHDELPDALAAADLVLSRAGANAIWEFCALGLPMLLIPLPLAASRGDQIKNAELFRSLGYAEILAQEEMTQDTLCRSLLDVWEKRDVIRAAQCPEDQRQGLMRLKREIEKAAKSV